MLDAGAVAGVVTSGLSFVILPIALGSRRVSIGLALRLVEDTRSSISNGSSIGRARLEDDASDPTRARGEM